MRRIHPIARLAVSLSIAAAIGAQIPVSGETALARDGYRNNFGKSLTVGLIGGVVLAAFGRRGHAEQAGGMVPAVPTGPAPCPAVMTAGDGSKSLYELLGTDSRSSFTGMRSLVDGSDEIVRSLGTDDPITVLAPENDAIGQLSAQSLSQIRGDKSKLTEFLKDHVIIGHYRYEDLCRLYDGKKLLLLSGNSVTLHNGNGKVTLNGVEVVPIDVVGSNGLIHPIKGIIRTNNSQ